MEKENSCIFISDIFPLDIFLNILIRFSLSISHSFFEEPPPQKIGNIIRTFVVDISKNYQGNIRCNLFPKLGLMPEIMPFILTL